MAPQGHVPATPKPLLQTLYESGYQSDLTVKTSDREFKVHKCVVGGKCSFFAAATRSGWAEAQTGIIQVEEPGAVMDMLFRHVYEIDLPIVPKTGDNREVIVGKGKPENFWLAMDVQRAADKYLLPDLKAEMNVVHANCLACSPLIHVVRFAQSLRAIPRMVAFMQYCLAVMMLASHVDKLLDSERCWMELHADVDLQKEVIFASRRLQPNGFRFDVDDSAMEELLGGFLRRLGINWEEMAATDEGGWWLDQMDKFGYVVGEMVWKRPAEDDEH